MKLIEKVKEFIQRKTPLINKDLETDVLLIGNGLESALIANEFLENDINTIIIDKNNSFKTPKSEEILESIEFSSLSISEIDKLELFKIILDSVYRLDELSFKLKNKFDYKRKPRINYSKEDLVSNSYPLHSNMIKYDFGVEINLGKLRNVLYKYLLRQNIRQYNNTEVVFYGIDSYNNFIVVTNRGYKIKCKRIINTNGENMFPTKINDLIPLETVKSFVGNNVIDGLLNAEILVDNYLGNKKEQFESLKFSH